MRFTIDMNKLCNFFEKRRSLRERYIHIPNLLHEVYMHMEAREIAFDENLILDTYGSL